MTEIVEIAYLGLISVNKYKIVKGGRPTNRTRPEVLQWMAELADRVRHLQMTPPIQVKLTGKFKDFRVPDLSNLHKVISDALQDGLQINDQNFFLVDAGVDVGYPTSTLVLEITDRYKPEQVFPESIDMEDAIEVQQGCQED